MPTGIGAEIFPAIRFAVVTTHAGSLQLWDSDEIRSGGEWRGRFLPVIGMTSPSPVKTSVPVSNGM
jgi:hypothetical protein